MFLSQAEFILHENWDVCMYADNTKGTAEVAWPRGKGFQCPGYPGTNYFWSVMFIASPL